MDFTFGIITDGNYDKNINTIIDSIESQNIPNYEIIIVGNSKIIRNNTKVIPFDENIKPKWITRKKNIITENAKYENVVYLHDYIYLLDSWYDGYEKYGNDFQVCMNKILNLDNSRFRDWTLCFYDAEPILHSMRLLIPYDMTHLSKIMYISGSYWVAKKDFMKKYPLNENLVWGQGEDIEWSKIVRNKIDFKMNIYSSVKLLKQKDAVFSLASEDDIKKLQNLSL